MLQELGKARRKMASSHLGGLWRREKSVDDVHYRLYEVSGHLLGRHKTANVCAAHEGFLPECLCLYPLGGRGHVRFDHPDGSGTALSS